jgi:hypothetical protein
LFMRPVEISGNFGESEGRNEGYHLATRA